jgi:hypothetical protein
MYRMAALGVCADLLSDDCLGEAIQLTVNKQASTSARAEFLVCLTPRLAQDSLRAGNFSLEGYARRLGALVVPEHIVAARKFPVRLGE